MHREPEGLEMHAFCGTGDENIMPTCRVAGITCPTKIMHREPEGLEVHAFCGTGDENIMPTCREAGY